VFSLNQYFMSILKWWYRSLCVHVFLRGSTLCCMENCVVTEMTYYVSNGTSNPFRLLWGIVFDSGRTALASSFPADILLYGSGINKCHCYLVVDGGTVTIHPLALLTSIDGVNVSSPTSLHHGKFRTISVVTELSVLKFFSLNCYIWRLKNQQKTFIWPISATVPVSSVISDILLLTI